MAQAQQIHFNITDFLTEVLSRAIHLSAIFSHIKMDHVLVCVSSNRGTRHGGVYGKLVPLRFKDGSEIVRHNRRIYTIPKIIHNNIRILYIIYFYMPKFFDLPPDKKIQVLFHELYHISPDFNGDIRRMGIVKAAHGFSRKRYDTHYHLEMKEFNEYIKQTELYPILAMNSHLLYHSFEKIVGRRMKIPKPLLVEQLA